MTIHNHQSHPPPQLDPSFQISDQDEISDYIFNWFLAEGESQETTHKLLTDLPVIFSITTQQAHQLIKEGYKHFKHLQRKSATQQLKTEKADLTVVDDSTITSNAFEDFKNKPSKAQVLFFPNLSKTANLVLSSYYNIRNSASSVKKAYERFQRFSDISERMFYEHTNNLYTKKYLILTTKGNPQLFKLNKEIYNAFEGSSNGVAQPFKPIQKSLLYANGPYLPPEQPSIVGPSSPDLPIELNLHNITAYIPCEIHDLVFVNLRAHKHDFILKREDTHLRYWGRESGDDFTFKLNGDTFMCAILIYRTSIELKFKEDKGTDIVLLVGSIMDRIMHILDWLKNQFTFIKFPVESDFKLYNSTGQVYHLEVELENVATDLLQEYVKATGHHEAWWLIDDLGNKIGFDSSARIKGQRRIPKVELKGDVVTLTNNLMTQFSAMAKGNVNVITTHQITQKLTKKVDMLTQDRDQTNLKISLLDSYTDQHLTALQTQADQLGQQVLSTKQTIVKNIQVTEQLLNQIYYQQDSIASNQDQLQKHQAGLLSINRSLESFNYTLDKITQEVFNSKKGLRAKLRSIF